MIKIRFFFLIGFFFSALIGYFFHLISIGAFWKIVHANSLIGSQKLIESTFLMSKNLDLYLEIFIITLEQSIFIFLSLIFFILFSILKLNSYISTLSAAKKAS